MGCKTLCTGRCFETWIMDEMKETPEEIIDYVMPIIKTL